MFIHRFKDVLRVARGFAAPGAVIAGSLLILWVLPSAAPAMPCREWLDSGPLACGTPVPVIETSGTDPASDGSALFDLAEADDAELAALMMLALDEDPEGGAASSAPCRVAE
jgi:hypothetical protein